MRNTVFVIVGPTCSGKTSSAVELCKKTNGVIVSADSRQIYKHMDIGTGKASVFPNAASVECVEDIRIVDGIDVYGYDLVSLDTYFSAYDYIQWAIPKINQLLKDNKTVFVVGGTGFYVDVITGRKQLAGVKPDLELRESLKTTPTKNLLVWLASLNPQVIERTDVNNRMRIIRALEIELKKEKKVLPPPHLDDSSFVYVGMTAARDYLYHRTDTWLDAIWQHGLIEETRSLMQKYPKSRMLFGLIYKSVLAFLNGDLSEEAAMQRAKFDLHAYVRRQQTWFKKNEKIKWFDITEDRFVESVYNHIKQWIKK